MTEELKAHPLADLFPLPEAARRAELGESIRTRGQRKVIVLLEGMILDGRTRYAECMRLGIAPKCRLYDPRAVAEGGDGPSPLDFVEDENLHRRDLTPSQRAAIAAEFESLRHGGRREVGDGQDANLQLDVGTAPSARASETRAALAERHGVSERSIADAAKVRDQGAPALQEALKAGDVVVDVAAALTAKPKDEQAALLANLPRDDGGKLTPEAKREVRRLADELKQEKLAEKRQQRDAREREQGQRQLALPPADKRYGIIVADPEWKFVPRSEATGMDRHAANHYRVSELDAIKARRDLIDRIADRDCLLALWVTDLANGIDVMRAWGFVPKSFRVWVKDVVDFPLDPATCQALGVPERRRYLQVVGPPGTGFGWGTSRAELVLFGTRGSPACPNQGGQGENVLFAARPHIEGTQKDWHSAKPDDLFAWLLQHFPTVQKIELNARGAREGFDVWGDEAPATELAADDGAPFDAETGELPPLPWSAGVDTDAAELGDLEAVHRGQFVSDDALAMLRQRKLVTEGYAPRLTPDGIARLIELRGDPEAPSEVAPAAGDMPDLPAELVRS